MYGSACFLAAALTAAAGLSFPYSITYILDLALPGLFSGKEGCAQLDDRYVYPLA